MFYFSAGPGVVYQGEALWHQHSLPRGSLLRFALLRVPHTKPTGGEGCGFMREKESLFPDEL